MGNQSSRMAKTEIRRRPSQKLGIETYIETAVGIGYRFVEGVGGLEEVELVYMHEEDEYTVEIRARSPFQVVPPALVPWAIEELANLVLARFFLARGAAV